MFFEKTSEIPEIASRIGTGIFVLPIETDLKIPDAIYVEPEKKSTITIEQVKDLLLRVNIKQTKDQFIIIRPADKLGLEAANALLKNLEEPNEKTHFILVTSEPSRIIPTILSRSSLYFLKDDFRADAPIDANEKTKEIAKRLLTARGAEVVDIADEITKKKEGSRAFALDVLGVAISMLYKTYFLTEKEVFIKKIPKFLAAYDAISKNGHVKLQIVANL